MLAAPVRDNLAAALEYASRGIAVFPLHAPAEGKPCDCGRDCGRDAAKHPWTRNGLLDATTDRVQVMQWWSEHPAANIGVVTGKVSGIVVVDIDPRHDGDTAWFKLMTDQGYEHLGPICATGGGGWHYWFAHPGEHVPSRSAEIAPGIDVKGDGGYVVAPPSLHASGVMYQWCEAAALDELPVGAIPTWLLGKMQEKLRQPYDGVASDAGVPGPIPEGRRHDWLVSRAGSLRARNFGEKAIFAALMAEATERFDSPWDETKVAKIAASAGSWAPGEAVILPSSSKKSSIPGKSPHIPQTFTVRELRGRVFDPVQWAIPGLVPSGLAILAGRPKLGKSWMALGWCIAIAQGGLAMEELGCDDGHVLMLALEDRAQRLQGRVQDVVGDEDGDWADRLHFETHWPCVGDGGLLLLDGWLGQHPECRLVVIDTFAKFKTPPGPNSKRGDVYAEDYAAVGEIKDLADRHGIAIVLVTHYNKAFNDDWINAVSGSSGLTGSADTLLGLERPRGTQGQKEAVLHVTGRDVNEADWAVEFDAGKWRIVGDADDARAKREHDTVVRAMERLAVAGHAIVDAGMIAAELDTTKPAAAKRLARAETAGAVQRVSHGFYTVSRVQMSKPATLDNLDMRHFGHETQSTLPLDSNASEQVFASRDYGKQSLDIDLDIPSGIHVQMSQVSTDVLPTVPCKGCGTVSWERRISGVLCGVCRPVTTRAT